MTYAIRVETDENGNSVVTSTAGDVPPGSHEIHGHDDGVNRNVQVIHRDSEGAFQIWASHYKHAEEP